MSKLTIRIDTPKGMRYATDILAALTRSGIVFTVIHEDDFLVVTITGY